jgi:hypothetical protein
MVMLHVEIELREEFYPLQIFLFYSIQAYLFGRGRLIRRNKAAMGGRSAVINASNPRQRQPLPHGVPESSEESVRRTTSTSFFLTGIYSLVEKVIVQVADQVAANSFTAQLSLWETQSELAWIRGRAIYDPL